MNTRYFSVLAAACLVTSIPCLGQAPQLGTVEAYVSPPQLFPSEGSPRAPYAPLDAFDHPSGRIIGQVVADLAPCPAGDDGYACGAPRAWHIKLKDGRRLELHHEMVGYDQESLVTYRPPVRASNKVWSQIDYEGGKFWVQTLPGETSDHESLATWAEDMDTWCPNPGQCAPLTPSMRAEIARVVKGEYQLASVSQQPYHIDGIVKRGGKRYYKVSLYESDKGMPRPALPKTGYIPTRRKDGSHVGQFSPKGC